MGVCPVSKRLKWGRYLRRSRNEQRAHAARHTLAHAVASLNESRFNTLKLIWFKHSHLQIRQTIVLDSSAHSSVA